MSDTLARLLGPEGQLEREIVVAGCPPVIKAAAMRPIRWVEVLEAMPRSLSYDEIDYVLEFAVPGNDHQLAQATYRRKVQWR